MKPLQVSHFTLTSALGAGREAFAAALREERGGLRLQRLDGSPLQSWIGAVDGLDTPLPAAWARWDCRNHRLLWRALGEDGFLAAARASVRRHGAFRVGVFVGTSTSGILSTERAYRERVADGPLPDWFDHRHTQSTHAPAQLLAEIVGARGPITAIATACSSSAKVFSAAQRAIDCGLCDAAIVGGVDSLCLTTLHGFNALQLLSADVCRPYDAARSGISIGEACGFALLEAIADSGAPRLLGYGESSDAHHMSAPDPDGRGAAAAMRDALARAGVAPGEIDYVCLHGTATRANDAAEDRALLDVLGEHVPCSSIKGWTGHTLGAAGVVGAITALLCLRDGVLPRSLNTRDVDPALRARVLLETTARPVRHVLANAFGFGGNNCSLLFGAPA